MEVQTNKYIMGYVYAKVFKILKKSKNIQKPPKRQNTKKMKNIFWEWSSEHVMKTKNV